MGADQNTDWRSIAISALDWWQDAGVDMIVDDAPRDWFAAPPTPAPPPVSPTSDIVAHPAAAPAGPMAPAPVAPMPDTLAEFLRWRFGPDAPEAAWHGPTVGLDATAADGPAVPTGGVMVLLDCPERDDVDRLMGGAEGRLFDAMLAAIGLSRDRIHLASLCTKRPTAGRIAQDAEASLADIARHHIALLAPQRLLLMGNAVSRAILAMDSVSARGRLHPFNHKTGQTGVVATYHPRFLIERPAAKAEAWKDLQMLMGGLMGLGAE